jgi:hypothetical protein
MVRALIVGLIAFGTGVAAAEPGLIWEAPDGCPDAEAVRLRIEQRVGTVPTDLMRGIEIEVSREGTGFVARIDLRGVTVANDVRTLRAPHCDDLTDAVAVVVSRVASEGVRVEPLPPIAPRTTWRRTNSLAVAVRSGRHRLIRDWGGGVRAMAVSGIGGVPEVGLGGELAGFVTHGPAFVELGWARWADSTVMLRSGPGVGVGLEVAALRVGWGPERLPIRAWIGGEVGAMRGEGMGSRPWSAATSGFGVAWPMSPWSRLVGSIEVVLPFDRAGFALADGHEVYRPGAMSSRAGLGLELGWR